MGLGSISVPQLGHRLWVQVVSIFIPGFFVSVELSTALSPGLLATAGRLELNALTTGFWFFFFLGLSYIVGLVARMIGFRIANWIRRPSNSGPSEEEAYKNAKEMYGSETVDLAMRASMLVDVQGRLLPGFFIFCKFWLRRYSAATTVDSHELEINARFALAVPVAISPLVVFRLLAIRDEPWMNSGITAILTTTSLLAAISLSVFLLKRGLRVQTYERQDALNYYIAVWLVHNSPPPNIAVSPGPLEGGSGMAPGVDGAS